MCSPSLGAETLGPSHLACAALSFSCGVAVVGITAWLEALVHTCKALHL